MAKENEDKIQEIPNIPTSLLEEAITEDNNLVIFIGAGISKLAGCDSWSDLAKNLVTACFDNEFIDSKEKKTLLQSSDYKKTITICHALLMKKMKFDVFYDTFRKSLKEDEKSEIDQEIFNEICQFNGTFVTTNADSHLYNVLRKYHPNIRKLYSKKSFEPEIIQEEKIELSRDNLYQIHGGIEEYESLVFTAGSYIKRYTSPIFTDLLNRLFSIKTVLFLGYGLAEYEVLDYLMKRVSTKKTEHYMLKAYKPEEQAIQKLEQAYYSDLNVKVIPYAKNKEGYKQLIHVLKEWNNRISDLKYQIDTEKVLPLPEKYKSILKTLKLPDHNKANNLLLDIKSNPQTSESNKKLLLQELIKLDSAMDWLVPLHELELLNLQGDYSDRLTISYILWVSHLIKKKPEAEEKETRIDIINTLLMQIARKIDSYNRPTRNFANQKFVQILANQPIAEIDQYIPGLIDRIKETGYEIGKYLFPILIQEQHKEALLLILDSYLNFVKRERFASEKYTSVIDNFFFQETLKQNKNGIAQLCGVKAAKIAIKYMRMIIREDKSQFNNFGICTIADSEQNTSTDRYDFQLVLFIRDMLEKAEPQKIETIVKEFMLEEHPIFKRLAYHLINHHYYSSLKNIFWTIEENPLNSIEKPELFQLLKQNAGIFSEPETIKILKWINKEAEELAIQHKGEDHLKEKTAYRKKEWLLALIENSKHPEVQRQYEKAHLINNTPVDHPGLSIYSESGPIIEKAPFIQEKFLAMNNKERAEFINNYQGDEWKGNTVISLEAGLRDLVSRHPQAFTDDLSPFLKIPLQYQNTLLSGFFQAWKENIEFDWRTLLLFIRKILEYKEIWAKDKESERVDYAQNIIDRIANLLQEGSKDPNRGFEKKALPDVKAILIQLLRKTQYPMEKKPDPVSSVINSSKGKVYIAALFFSWYEKRLNDTTQWDPDIKAIFEDHLSQKEIIHECYLTLAMYYSLVYELAPEWAENSIQIIFPLNKTEQWADTFYCYTLMTPASRKGLFPLLKEHYLKAINYPFQDQSVTEQIIRHILHAYLEEVEELTNPEGLLNNLLEKKDPVKIEQIVTILWHYLGHKDRGKTKLIKPLWGKIIEILKGCEKEQCRSIAIDLNNWLSLVDEIDDEIYGYMEFSIRFLNDSWKVNTVMDYFELHIEKTPEKIGKLFGEMVKTGTFPRSDVKQIRKIIKHLYLKGQIKDADFICTKYLEKGYTFLHDILEKLGYDCLEMANAGMTPLNLDEIKWIVEELYKNGFKDLANQICEKYKENGDSFLDDIFEKYN